jgi:cold shock CspA family protein
MSIATLSRLPRSSPLLEGFGFVEAPDGRKLRFHRESCIVPSFEQLEVGDAVQFVAEYGPDGLHAKRESAIKHQVTRSHGHIRRLLLAMSAQSAPPQASVTREFWRRFLAIAGPYWRSDDKTAARALLALAALILLAQTGFNVLYVTQTGEVTSALAARDADRFWSSIAQCAVTLLISVPVYAFYYYMRDRLAL